MRKRADLFIGYSCDKCKYFSIDGHICNGYNLHDYDDIGTCYHITDYNFEHIIDNYLDLVSLEFKNERKI